MGTNTRSLISLQPQADVLTYEPFFGLKEKPFSLTSDPRFLYSSPSHAATFENLLAGIRRREGLLVLTGEIGTGKTTLCRAVLRNLGRKTFSSFVPDPFASREDLLKMLLIDFGVLSIQDLTNGSLKDASRTELSYLLSEFLDSIAVLDAFVVVIIDEAQNMSLPLIEETRILSDSFGAKGHLQIVFVGQPELHAKLQTPEMRQVDQRVSAYSRLAPLGRDAVAGYVEHRLHVAGGSRERVLFSPDVIDILHRRSGGVPRLVNRICDRALHLAHRQQAACVTLEILEKALIDVGPTTLTPTWASIVFPEPQVAEGRSASSPIPAAAVELPTAEATTPAARIAPALPPATAASTAQPAPPLEHEEHFSQRVDEWLARELAPTSRTFTPLQEFAGETRETPAPRPQVDVEPRVNREALSPRRRKSEQPVTYIQKLGRLWLKIAAIAIVGVAAVNLAVVGASRLPDALAFLMTEAPTQPTLPASPTLERPTPAAPPVEASSPVETTSDARQANLVDSGDYLVAVGLFASQERADRLVQELNEAGLPALQRPFQLRSRRLQQVVLGPFIHRSDAVALLQQLRQRGGYDDANVVDTFLESSAPSR